MVLVPCLWHVMWPQLGGYCRRWTRAVLRWFRVENWRCTGAAKELFGTAGRGSHNVAWLGASYGTPRLGIHVVAWLGASSGTL